MKRLSLFLATLFVVLAPFAYGEELSPPEQTPTPNFGGERPTPTPLVQPTATADMGIPRPTSTPLPPSEDVYEVDSADSPPIYMGEAFRSFNPAGDVDYFQFRLSLGMVTTFETFGLTNGADTEIAVFASNGVQLGYDNNSGAGMGDKVVISAENDFIVRVEIRNRSLASGADVTYRFRISQAAPQPTNTPTILPTLLATTTPQPTYTPLPTYTPFPTTTPLPTATTSPIRPTQTPTRVWPTATTQPVWPTATPRPTWSPTQPSASPTRVWPAATSLPTGPWYTATPTPLPTTTPTLLPTVRPVIRVVAPVVPTQIMSPTATPALTRTVVLQVYSDANNDGGMMLGEGIENLFVICADATGQWTEPVWLKNGELEVGVPVSAETLLIALPYLHQGQQINLSRLDRPITFVLPAPELPVVLP